MEQEERILLKAHELFMLYGIRSVSMDEIATHLGISKKTIYQYYPDKEALVECVVDIELNSNVDKCNIVSGICENPVHEFFLGIDNLKEMFSMMNPSLVYDLEKYHPIAFKKVNDHKQKYIYQVIKDNLDKGVLEGYYRDDINTEILAKFRLASVFLMFNQELFPQIKYNSSDLIDTISDNFLSGIVTPKGQKLITTYKSQRSNKIKI